MAYLVLDLPPGLYRNGTERQARGRWHDGNLIRFYEGTIRPIGGWRAKTDITLTGKGRAILGWRDNNLVVWVAVGTEQKLYAITRSGYVYDITPTGYTPGFADASAAPGYGGGPYGAGDYGSYAGGSNAVARGFGGGNYGAGVYSATPPDTASVQPATVWSLDNWGEDLIGCTADDGVIYQWAPNTSVPASALVNAPSAAAVVVSDQRIVMALGAGGVPRRVQWSDQGNNTTWTPSLTNQAGSYDLQTAGRLMLGKRWRGTVLLLTDIDAHLASYTGDVYVYGFQKIGDGCGAISAGCAASLGDFVVWMGDGAFYTYSGVIEKLTCDVSDELFGNLNFAQASKLACFINSAFSEVTWFYPSEASTEVDSYVTWNYRENHWTMGELARLSGIDRGPMTYPLLVGADGYVYEHEQGFTYQDVNGAPQKPYLESGPFEFGAMPFIAGAPPISGNGDLVIYARLLLADDRTAGDVSVTFKTKFYPDGPETSYGPYAVAQSTDVRFSGRQVRLRYDGVNSDDWRVGSPRLDVVTGGRR